MTTTLIKFALSGRLSPFTFKKAPNFLPDTGTLDYGLYVHIPFCRTICPFCPYYKTLYDESLMADYAEALLLEIETASMRADKPRGKATTLYFGGGSPALAAPYLTRVMERFRSNFGFDGHAGIELHPRDATDETLAAVKASGIDMVSLGAQSFQPKLLDALDRGQSSPLEALRRIAGYGFTAVDVDLIFGIPGQTDADLAEDFRIAARNGATQISTYPFIDFSYANNRRKPLGRGEKKRMLRTLAEVSEAEGFARTSVWTFGKAAAPRYSSITRDNFLGFGPSATSLGVSDFKINTFSVPEYIASVRKGEIPSALAIRFDERSRGMYWLFWNCYVGTLSTEAYARQFGRDLSRDFGPWLRAAERMGWLQGNGESVPIWNLTARGSYAFHLVEQKYTHQYIDKTWRTSLRTPWPESIKLY